MDFLQKVERPATRQGADVETDAYANLLDRYHNRPDREKERFAHDYAERLRKHLVAIRAIPFDRQCDRECLMQDGLRLQDFALPPN